MTTKVRIHILGAAGYTGGELLRLLSCHPLIEIGSIFSESWANKRVCECFPGIHLDQTFTKPDPDKLKALTGIVFLAQENGYAMQHAKSLLQAGCKLIDLSADFRIRATDIYTQWYKLQHTAQDLLQHCAYGLPEIYRDKIKVSQLIANPGCYPTATTLALAPFIKANIIKLDSIIIDAKSGVSGAGRSKFTLDYHFAEVNESLRAYGLGGAHRHTPEIEQNCSDIANHAIKVTFSPHLVPITRGILSTCYATLNKDFTTQHAIEILNKFYQDERFIKVLPEGQYPSTKSTYGTNYCHIGAVVDSRTKRLVIVSAIDNLVKGASGQAIQNMNIIANFPEDTGLQNQGVWP